MQPRFFSLGDLTGGLGRLGITVAKDGKGRYYAEDASGKRVPVILDATVTDQVPGMHVLFIAEELVPDGDVVEVYAAIEQYRRMGDP